MTEDEFGQWLADYSGWKKWRRVHSRPARTEKGWRTALQGDPGYPDWTLARAGRIVIAELKVPPIKWREGQKEWLEALTGMKWGRGWHQEWAEGVLVGSPWNGPTHNVTVHVWLPEHRPIIEALLS